MQRRGVARAGGAPATLRRGPGAALLTDLAFFILATLTCDTPPRPGCRAAGDRTAGPAQNRPCSRNAAHRDKRLLYAQFCGCARLAEARVITEPGSVERGETIMVSVVGKGINEWYVGVSSESGEVKSVPTQLEAYGPPARSGGGELAYSFSIDTSSYAHEEYRVSVSPSKEFVGKGTRIKKFSVMESMPVLIGLSGDIRSRFGPAGEWRL